MPFTGYRITSPFGYRTHPITGKKQSFHTGIDLVKPHKSPIHSFTDGTVLFSGMGKSGSGFGGYGNVVLIKDSNNRGHVYAHLDSVSVKKGQKVSKGQVVGRQGNTGNSTGSHLHYEVRKKAESSVPYGWIADRKNNCLEPTEYLRGFTGNVKTASVSNKNVIKDIQNTLNSRYGLNIDVDGIYGKNTKTAIVKAFQTELNKQYNAGLKVDGIWGAKTRAKAPTIRKNARGNLTWILQAMLNCLGYSTNGIDSIYGNGTFNAVKKFQKDKSLSPDGVAGKNTFDKLFG